PGALKAAGEMHPSLIILDMMRPDRTGLEIIGELKQICGDSPILIVTASHDMETTIRAMKLGAFDYIHKPFPDPAALDLVVARALRMRQLSRRAESGTSEHPTHKLGDIVGTIPGVQHLVTETRTLSGAPRATAPLHA